MYPMLTNKIAVTVPLTESTCDRKLVCQKKESNLMVNVICDAVRAEIWLNIKHFEYLIIVV